MIPCGVAGVPVHDGYFRNFQCSFLFVAVLEDHKSTFVQEPCLSSTVAPT